jgi:hypothetical protein
VFDFKGMNGTARWSTVAPQLALSIRIGRDTITLEGRYGHGG